MTPDPSASFITPTDSQSSETERLEASFLAQDSVDISVEETSPEPSTDLAEPMESAKSGNRGWVWVILLLAGLGGMGWLVYTKVILPMSAPGGPEFGPMPVAIAQPKRVTIQANADYIATLDSRESVTVQPQAAGRISQIFVKSGDRVQAGAPLLRLDAQQQEAQVAGSQADIDAASADIVAAQADVESARRSLTALKSTLASRQSDLKFKQQEYDRFKTLQTKGATSLQTLQEKRSALNQAVANVAEMEAQISTQDAVIIRAQATVVRQRQQKDAAIAAANQDQVQLQYYTVNAPINGTIGDMPAKIGDLVNESTALLTLTQNQALEINIEVPQETINRLALGTPVQLLDTDNQVLKNGSVSYIAPDVSSETQSVQVKAQFSNAGGQLRTNQMIKARIISSSRPGLVVPTTAISRLAGKNFVFVAQPYGSSECSRQDETAQPAPRLDQWVAVQKPVELGSIIKNGQHVSQGINIGDRVVTSGLLQLQNCMPIQPTS